MTDAYWRSMSDDEIRGWLSTSDDTPEQADYIAWASGNIQSGWAEAERLKRAGGPSRRGLQAQIPPTVDALKCCTGAARRSLQRFIQLME